jgi:hypothetical protein
MALGEARPYFQLVCYLARFAWGAKTLLHHGCTTLTPERLDGSIWALM